MLILYYAIGIIVMVSACIALKNVVCWCLCGDDEEDDEEPRPKYEPKLPSSLYWKH